MLSSDERVQMTEDCAKQNNSKNPTKNVKVPSNLTFFHLRVSTHQKLINPKVKLVFNRMGNDNILFMINLLSEH